MQVKGVTDELRPFFNGFNETKNLSTVLRKKSWHRFPYEKTKSLKSQRLVNRRDEENRQIKSVTLKHIQYEQMLKYEFHNISCMNAEKNSQWSLV